MIAVQSISSNASGATQKETQVQTQASQLRETLGTLSDRLLELGCRIEPVLRNELECVGKKEVAPPQDYIVPLAADYRANREQVETMIARVGSYLNRLEL